MRGFGFQLDIASGRTRQWYSGKDGVKRWLDSDEPCRYTQHLSESFDKLFTDILPPDPLAATEAHEGIAALTDEENGNDD